MSTAGAYVRSRSIRVFDASRAMSLAVSDTLAFSLASAMAVLIIRPHVYVLSYSRIGQTAIVCSFVAMLTFRLLGLYRISYAMSSQDELYYVVAGLSIGAFPILALFTIVPSLSSSRLVLILSYFLSIIFAGGARSFLHGRRQARSESRIRVVALVGPADRLSMLVPAFEADRSTSVIAIDSDSIETCLDAMLAGNLGWYNDVRRRGCREIVFAGQLLPAAALFVERAARDGIRIAFATPGLECPQVNPMRLETRQRQAVLVADRVPICSTANALVKRAFDLAVAFVCLTIALPIIALAGLAVVAESGRPMFYRQTRIGRDGKPFQIFKLRSMVQGAESESGAQWATPHDNRATRFGRFIRATSIDELPQFLNVLRGEMSVVGPRPERPEFVARFRREHSRYDQRHMIRPGITGWSQMHMRRNPDIASIAEKTELDLFYIENYSILMDISLVLKSAAEVLFKR